jgi:DNA-binding transcriptional MerR regulator
MYTPSQASEMLNIPSSTLRRYANQFSSHLSEHARRERGRRYTEQDIALLAKARELLSEGASPDKANELLALVGDEPPPPESTLALIPSISQALSEALDTARALRIEVSELSQKQSATDSTLSELAERLAALEAERSMPWYKRLLRRAG